MRSLRLVLSASALCALLVGGEASFAWSSTAPPTPTAGPGCVVKIASFVFKPDTAVAGDHVTLKLRLRNCTAEQQDVTVTQYGLQPPGCAVMDPVSRPVSIDAGGVYRSRSRMIAPSCTGTESMTVNIAGASGTQLATSTAKLTVT